MVKITLTRLVAASLLLNLAALVATVHAGARAVHQSEPVILSTVRTFRRGFQAAADSHYRDEVLHVAGDVTNRSPVDPQGTLRNALDEAASQSSQAAVHAKWALYGKHHPDNSDGGNRHIVSPLDWVMGRRAQGTETVKHAKERGDQDHSPDGLFDSPDDTGRNHDGGYLGGNGPMGDKEDSAARSVHGASETSTDGSGPDGDGMEEDAASQDEWGQRLAQLGWGDNILPS